MIQSEISSNDSALGSPLTKTCLALETGDSFAARSQDVVEEIVEGRRIWEVPASANTRYLSHDFFRYIGKFPPQIAAKFILEMSKPNDLVVDPMCGGGTVLLESRLLGRRALGWDINPVSLLVSRVVCRHIPDALLKREVTKFKNEAQDILSPGSLFQPRRTVARERFVDGEEFFSEKTRKGLSGLMGAVAAIEKEMVREFVLVAILSILRKVSLANVKKMNIVIDPGKKSLELLPTLFAKLDRMGRINSELGSVLGGADVVVQERDAIEPANEGLGRAQLVVIHPPYISNTAFSESTRLQLGLLGIQHRNIWKRELRVRGSYVHEPDGLRKYLVGWHKILSNAFRLLKSGGYCVTVIGDGKIDFVRIPVAPITQEFGKDVGFKVAWTGEHRLNNNTGWTLSHKMKEQHMIVFRKPE